LDRTAEIAGQWLPQASARRAEGLHNSGAVGKAEVDSSILSGGTIRFNELSCENSTFKSQREASGKHGESNPEDILARFFAKL
jgi:hypothetical protein